MNEANIWIKDDVCVAFNVFNDNGDDLLKGSSPCRDKHPMLIMMETINMLATYGVKFFYHLDRAESTGPLKPDKLAQECMDVLLRASAADVSVGFVDYYDALATTGDLMEDIKYTMAKR